MKRVVIRLDDVGRDDWPTQAVLHGFVAYELPVTCAVVPKLLTPKLAYILRRLRDQSAGSLEFIQHGYSHANHAPPGELKYEFGPSRSRHQQHLDVRRGQRILRRCLGEPGLPIFSPPHDRLDQTTLAVLVEQGFRACAGGPRTFRELSPPAGMLTLPWHVDASRRVGGIRRARSGASILTTMESHRASTLGLVLHAADFKRYLDFAKLLYRLLAGHRESFQCIPMSEALSG